MDQVRIAAKGKLGVDAIYIHRNFAVLARISKEYLAWEQIGAGPGQVWGKLRAIASPSPSPSASSSAKICQIYVVCRVCIYICTRAGKSTFPQQHYNTYPSYVHISYQNFLQIPLSFRSVSKEGVGSAAEFYICTEQSKVYLYMQNVNKGSFLHVPIYIMYHRGYMIHFNRILNVECMDFAKGDSWHCKLPVTPFPPPKIKKIGLSFPYPG